LPQQKINKAKKERKITLVSRITAGCKNKTSQVRPTALIVVPESDRVPFLGQDHVGIVNLNAGGVLFKF
jgi:hypothetical protein